MSRRLLVLLAAGGWACAAKAPQFPEAPALETARQPPSFAAEPTVTVIDSPATAPEANGSRAAWAVEPVVLPLDPDEARQVVNRFFVAVLLESTRELFPLLAAQAGVVSEGGRQAAQAVWRARFAQLDYTSLSGHLVAAPQTLRTYTFDGRARAKRDGAPTPASADEVVVVAKLGLAGSGKARLFGDMLAFRLQPRRDRTGFEIAEIVEDFRLP